MNHEFNALVEAADARTRRPEGLVRYGKVTPEQLRAAAGRADKAGQLGLAVHLYALALWLKDDDGFDLPRRLDYDRAIGVGMDGEETTDDRGTG